jgi:hypothetical protein
VAQLLALHPAQELPLPGTWVVNPMLSRVKETHGDIIRRA